ncbi:MAG: hypothetical protein JST81_07140 [Bacteroidetes bacterium]|nr:hypothetical protein [Bacteroidota bacterium]
MRIAAIIIASFILLMPVQPAIAMLCAKGQQEEGMKCCKKKKSCCKEKADQQKNKEGKSCDSKNCPMEFCYGCCYIATQSFFIENVIVHLKSEILPLIDEDNVTGFSKDSFHPPEQLYV